MKRRLLISVLMALTLVSPGAVSADNYCDVDPGLPIRTPGGSTVVLHISNAGPTDHRPQLAQPTLSYTATRASDGGTDVTVSVTIANDDAHGHTLVSEIWDNPGRWGTLLSSQTGTFGTTVVHSVHLSTP